METNRQSDKLRIIEQNHSVRVMETIWVAKSSDDYYGSESIPTIPVPKQADNEQSILKTTYYGDRMHPTLNSGDQVILRKIDPKAFIEWGEIYMLQVQDNKIFCRVTPGRDESSVMISYDNPKDNITQEIPLNSISHFWKLFATARIN